MEEQVQLFKISLFCFFFFKTLSVLHQTISSFFFFENNKNCIHLFYYSSSIYRYILVKRNMRAFILLENSKFGNFYTIVKTLYFRLKKKKKTIPLSSSLFLFLS
uniref:Uncharacterized protein n=1 Tax=Stegastes partitus TaxID=144197 RepID=A0A3B5AK77_9TELE